ncbi:hypothetical protein AB1L30_12005 [Bremerella sp. JC817]|uniref:hypothetical protein n=1 Tax=Bremerella sp. JC817 TaxID=3231756 RepID=UPI003457BFCD
MTFPATILTLVAMLWHALAGCCAHHSHAPLLGPEGCSTASQQLHEHYHGCSHHHGHAVDDHEHADHDEHSDTGECGQSDCVMSASTSDSDGHLSMVKQIGSQLYFDANCLPAFDSPLGQVAEEGLLEICWLPPEGTAVYLQFESMLL